MICKEHWKGGMIRDRDVSSLSFLFRIRFQVCFPNSNTQKKKVLLFWDVGMICLAFKKGDIFLNYCIYFLYNAFIMTFCTSANN